MKEQKPTRELLIFVRSMNDKRYTVASQGTTRRSILRIRALSSTPEVSMLGQYIETWTSTETPSALASDDFGELMGGGIRSL